MGGAVDRGVRRRARGDELVAAHDAVLVAEARTADLGAPGPDREHVVEGGRRLVVELHSDRQRLDALLADVVVATGERVEIGDARLLQPHDVGGVMRDALRVRLGEADTYLVGEDEAVHVGQRQIYLALRWRAWGARASLQS